MSNEVVELELTETEVQKLNAQKVELTTNSRLAAQKAWDFAELLANTVKAANAAQDAKVEYERLLVRAAKARGRQYDDILDLDLNAKSITFRKTKKEVARDAANEAPSDETESDQEADTPDA